MSDALSYRGQRWTTPCQGFGPEIVDTAPSCAVRELWSKSEQRRLALESKISKQFRHASTEETHQRKSLADWFGDITTGLRKNLWQVLTRAVIEHRISTDKRMDEFLLHIWDLLTSQQKRQSYDRAKMLMNATRRISTKIACRPNKINLRYTTCLGGC